MGCVEAVPARVSLGILVATGVMMLYMLRVNLSVAIVAMVRTPSTTSSLGSSEEKVAYCRKVNISDIPNVSIVSTTPAFTDSNSTFTNHLDDEVEITDQLLLTGAQKGMILGAFFYGYIFTSIPGGRLAELYGTKIVFGGAILVSGLLTLFIPLAARTSYIALIIIRILIGVAQGVVYPSMHVLVARWIPPMERPRFISITYMANCLGTILTLPVCGVIIDAVGWQAVFYISGSLSLVWLVFWTLLMSDSPRNHPRISEKEKLYILESIAKGTTQQKPNQIPWRKFMTNLPLWATNMAHIGAMFGFTLLITQLPSYMDSVLGFSIKNNGLLSSLPFLAQFLGSTACGLIGDYLLTRKYISVAVARRMFVTISLFLPAITLVAVGYAGCNTVLAVTLFPVSAACMGAMGAGHMANQLDLTPNFAGTVLGIANTIAFGVSMLAPIIVGALTPDQSLEQWQSVFMLTGGLYIVCWIFYMAFAKFEIQPLNFSIDKEPVKNTEEQLSFISNDAKPKIVRKSEGEVTESV